MASYFLRLFRFCFSMSRSTSSFGTWISLRVRASNAPKPRGLRAAFFMLLLLLNAHETSVVDGAQFAERQPLPQHAFQQRQEPIAVVLSPHAVAERVLCTVPLQMERRDV